MTKTENDLCGLDLPSLLVLVGELDGRAPAPEALIDPSLPPTPTDAPPGSPRKLAILEERARQGNQLFHPGDAPPAPRDRTNAEQLLRQALAERWTLREVAEALGCSRSFAHARLKRLRENGRDADSARSPDAAR